MSNVAHLTLQTVAEGLRFRWQAGGGTEGLLDSGPGRVAPSPVEALLGALGGCEAMDVISILRKKRQKVTAYEVLVTGERRAEHPRRFTKIEIVHRVTGHELSARAIEEAIQLSSTKYCSVHASMLPEIVITSRFDIVAAT